MESNTEIGIVFEVGSLYERFRGVKDNRKHEGYGMSWSRYWS
jgi:hypothetical protein